MDEIVIPNEFISTASELLKPKEEQVISKWGEAIVKEAMAQKGTTVYRTAATKDGRLACAAFVSGVLKKAGAMKGNGSLGQRELERILRAQGWKEVWLEDHQAGDVVFWNPYPGRFHGHVGIIANRGESPELTITIDNSSSKKVPVSRPLNTVRPIRCVLRKE